MSCRRRIHGGGEGRTPVIAPEGRYSHALRSHVRERRQARGRTGEPDHRVRFFFGGRIGEWNLWPEAGPVPNRKGALERHTRMSRSPWNLAAVQ
jgi:hypothetical protein